MAAWIMLIALFGAVSTIWFWKRIVIEFSYDGEALRLRTLGAPEMQTRAIQEIVEVGDWRGRGGSQGYKIRFRDGQKAYLQFGVPNADRLAGQIRRDIRPSL